jgi:IclR family transcriptional regulator, KDG regulon repressor
VADATSLVRGLTILVALGSDESVQRGGLGVVRLAELIGADKGQVSRTMRTLERLGFAERDADTRAYRLGWRTFALAARTGESRLLLGAPRILSALVERTGESAHLSVLDAGEVLTVLTQSPPSRLHVPGVVGRRSPVHSSSAGRALLFDHDTAAICDLLGPGPLPLAAPHPPLDAAGLAARVRQAVAPGYAVVDEEFEPGVIGIAAPVRDAAGRIAAAVNISAPRFRLHERTAETAAAVTAAASQISRLLGG